MTWPCPRLASVWPETEDIRSLPDSWEDQSRAIRLRGSGDTGGCEHTALHPWISPYLSCSQVQLFPLHLGKLSPQRRPGSESHDLPEAEAQSSQFSCLLS